MSRIDCSKSVPEFASSIGLSSLIDLVLPLRSYPDYSHRFAELADMIQGGETIPGGSAQRLVVALLLTLFGIEKTVSLSWQLENLSVRFRLDPIANEVLRQWQAQQEKI